MLLLDYWRQVTGYENRYEVSVTGCVRNVETQRMLKPGIGGAGYQTVSLGRCNSRTVHSLVAEAFVGPRPIRHDVMHLDGTRHNARLSNLTFGTRAQNNRQALQDGRRKVSVADVRAIRDALARGVSGVSLAREYSLSQSQISNIRHARQYIID